MDFIHKLDTKRYEKMLVHMRRNALCNGLDAYPTTLASALRIASGWVDKGSSSLKSGGTGTETHSAFVTADLNLVTKSKDTSKKQSTIAASDVTAGSERNLFLILSAIRVVSLAITLEIVKIGSPTTRH